MPPAFIQALLSLRDAPKNSHLRLEEVPPPKRLAPFTAALAIQSIDENHGQALTTGRLVVLHDPNSQPGWNGTFRIVAQLRSHIDPEMSTDPLLSEALWGWAAECLDIAGAGLHDLTGTVTREMSESFGGLELHGSSMNVEVRASWTPNTAELGEHLVGWTDFMCRTAGITTERFLEGV
ncbi:DUF3000 domain-containing protein [Schaalia sp. ZJ405]|nr:DUF3000 domain-containing protein [Schaalia sp. ZJ405]